MNRIKTVSIEVGQMAAKRKPLVIPAHLLKENTKANRKEIGKLIKERLDWNKKNLPPSQYRDGIPEGKFKFGDIEIEISGAGAYSRTGKGLSLPTVTDAEKIRAAELVKQTSKKGGVKKVTYGRGARGLKAAMQDHHIRFRTLFQPFYEGLNEKDAKELTEWFVQGKSPLGNVLENLEGVDADLHEELDRSIHQWAKENQIQVDQFSKEEWARGDRNIPIDPDTGKVKISEITDLPEVKGGASGEWFVGKDEINPATGKRWSLIEMKAEQIRRIQNAKFPQIGGDLNARKNAARLYLDTIEEPLLNKTAEILEEQDLRYAAKDPNYKPKTKAQWLKKWDESTTAAAETSEWLEDVANKNPDLDVKMSDIDDIIANPDAPLSKAAAKRLKVKPTSSALSALKRIGIGGAVELKDVKNLLIGKHPAGTLARGLLITNVAGGVLDVKAGTGALDKTKSKQERTADALQGVSGALTLAGIRGNIPAAIGAAVTGGTSWAMRNRLQRDARRERDQQIRAGEIWPSVPDNLTIKQWDPEQERVDRAMQLQINR